MTQDIFIGIDGGGTKCKIRVESADGQLIGQSVSGPSNIRLSVKTAWQSIYHALSEVLDPAQISLEDKNYRFHAGMGLAGFEVKEMCHEFLNQPHPFTTLELNSDAHIACMGAHGGKEGAIIIVGTGAVGYQIQAGHGIKVSGWGFPHDDEGGGAWLGLEAVRLTFQWLDHRVEKSPLVDDVFSFFNRDLEQFVSWSNRANSTEFARLAPLVINHSQQEELAAVRLMKKAAHAIDRIGVALAKTQKTPLRCCLFGGIAPFLEPWLSEELRATLAAREADATVGAILMVQQAMKNSHSNKKEITQ